MSDHVINQEVLGEHGPYCNCEDCCYARGGEVCPTCGCLVENCPESKENKDE